MEWAPDHDLRLVLDCYFPLTEPRDLPAIFPHVVQIVEASGVDYVVTGRRAYAQFCPAQCTDVISLTLDTDGKSVLPDRLRAEVARLRSETSTVRLDVATVCSPIEKRFMDLAPRKDWLGIDTKLATIEHLLWEALHSDDPYAGPIAISLINSDRIDWDVFKNTVGEIDKRT